MLVGAAAADPKVFAAWFLSLCRCDFDRKEAGLAKAFLLAHDLDANLFAWNGKRNEINLAPRTPYTRAAVGDAVDFETQLWPLRSLPRVT